MPLPHFPCDVAEEKCRGFYTLTPDSEKGKWLCLTLSEVHGEQGELMETRVLSLQRWCGSICPWNWSTSACCSSAARCCRCSCASGPGSPPRSAGVSCSTPSPQSSPFWEVRLASSRHCFAVLVLAVTEDSILTDWSNWSGEEDFGVWGQWEDWYSHEYLSPPLWGARRLNQCFNGLFTSP